MKRKIDYSSPGCGLWSPPSRR